MSNKVNEKILTKISKKCSVAHGKLQENLRHVQKCLDEAQILFHFFLKWSNSMKRIMDQMESIES